MSAKHPPDLPFYVSDSFADIESRIDFLTEQLTLFGIEFQVWHFVYLGIAAIALISARNANR